MQSPVNKTVTVHTCVYMSLDIPNLLSSAIQHTHTYNMVIVPHGLVSTSEWPYCTYMYVLKWREKVGGEGEGGDNEPQAYSVQVEVTTAIIVCVCLCGHVSVCACVVCFVC